MSLSGLKFALHTGTCSRVAMGVVSMSYRKKSGDSSVLESVLLVKLDGLHCGEMARGTHRIFTTGRQQLPIDHCSSSGVGMSTPAPMSTGQTVQASSRTASWLQSTDRLDRTLGTCSARSKQSFTGGRMARYLQPSRRSNRTNFDTKTANEFVVVPSSGC